MLLLTRSDIERTDLERCLTEIQSEDTKRFWKSEKGIRRTKEDAERAKQADRRIRKATTV